MKISLNINGADDIIQRAFDLLQNGHLQLSDKVSLEFSGSPVFKRRQGNGYVDLLWEDKVEVNVPGFIDPDVSYVRVYEDRCEVRFKIGGKVVVK